MSHADILSSDVVYVSGVYSIFNLISDEILIFFYHKPLFATTMGSFSRLCRSQFRALSAHLSIRQLCLEIWHAHYDRFVTRYYFSDCSHDLTIPFRFSSFIAT